MRRARTVIGLGLVAAASFLALDGGTRLRALTGTLATSWPYLLGVFAAVALLATLAEVRRLLGIGAVAAVAIVGILEYRQQVDLLAFWPVVAIVVGAGVALGGGPGMIPDHVVSVVWPVRRIPRDDLPERVAVTCVLGTVQLDLRDTNASAELVLAVTTFIGHVSVKVPAHWPIVIDGEPSRTVNLDERGRRDMVDTTRDVIRLRSAGVFGLVVVERY